MNKALVVGVDDYGGRNSLNGCCSDAKSIAALLEKNEDGSHNFDVSLEKNVRRKADLVKALRKLFWGSGDLALFYFAGHGTMVDGDSYIVLPDIEEGDEGVRLSALLDMANRSSYKTKVIILDCCHSGGITMPESHLRPIAQLAKGVVILSACREDQSAAEDGEHGVFTRLLIESLNGAAANVMGEVTPSLIYACIDRVLGVSEQRPLFAANVSQGIVLRRLSPRIDMDVLRRIPRYFKSPDAIYPLDPSYERTNIKGGINRNVEPYANIANCKILDDLQALVKVGLVIPHGATHMYDAVMDSLGCKLTNAGAYYWKLATKKRI